MKYINKTLTIEKVNLQKIANKFGTPFYSYSYSKLKENINNFKKNFRSFSPLICFAVKSNTNVNIIREIKKFGLGADVVSVGELMMALKAGINPSKIVFSGVGKTTSEISFAIDKKILLINTESLSEIKEINRIAKSKNKRIKIGVRLNPNTDAKTLSQISTGKKEIKFGYRTSNNLEGKIIVSAKLLGIKGEPKLIKERLKEYTAYRKNTQPAGIYNAGSVVKNHNDYSAGELIDKAGLKGYEVDGGRVSSKHANFFIASKGSKSSSLHKLVDHVKDVVDNKFGVSLEKEIIFVGNFE